MKHWKNVLLLILSTLACVASQNAATSVSVNSGSLNSDVSTLRQSFFGSLKNFSGVTNYWNPGNSHVDVTAGVQGGWIQGTFSTPFAVTSWVWVGYSLPIYLMGSNDSVTFYNVSIITTTVYGDVPPYCGSQGSASLCGSATVSGSPAYTTYRAVTNTSNYNSALTMYSSTLSPPPSVLSPPPPVLSPPPALSSPPPAMLGVIPATTVSVNTGSATTSLSTLGQSFFGSLTNYSGATNYWNPINVSAGVTGGVLGGWIQGTYAQPFRVTSWIWVGYSVPVYLMGSNDGVTFSNVSVLTTSSFGSNPPYCGSQGNAGPCGYVIVSGAGVYSVYRAVAVTPTYNSGITLLGTLFPSPPSPPVSPPPPALSPPPPGISPPPAVVPSPPPVVVLSPPPTVVLSPPPAVVLSPPPAVVLSPPPAEVLSPPPVSVSSPSPQPPPPDQQSPTPNSVPATASGTLALPIAAIAGIAAGGFVILLCACCIYIARSNSIQKKKQGASGKASRRTIAQSLRL